MIDFIVALFRRRQPRVPANIIAAVLATTYDRNDRREWMGF